MDKDVHILDLLNWLRERLGNQFDVTDHWEADLCAIGISAPDDPSQLAYILYRQEQAESYAVHLESAPLPGSGIPYQDVGKFDSVNREDLLEILTSHLRIS